jgi:sugar-specific transcriptional regulator TrmB
LNRGTTYDVLKKLAETGLVTYFHKATKQKFVAEDPVKLQKVIADREQELQHLSAQLNEIIPELKSLQEKSGGAPVTKFYEGRRGVKMILEDILSHMAKRSESTYYVYSAAGVREDVYGAYPDFNKKRIRQKIKAKTISLSPGGGTYGLDERKWLSHSLDQPGNMTYIVIYSGRCAFIARGQTGEPLGVIIENQMIYATQQAIFLQLWSLLK